MRDHVTWYLIASFNTMNRNDCERRANHKLEQIKTGSSPGKGGYP